MLTGSTEFPLNFYLTSTKFGRGSEGPRQEETESMDVGNKSRTFFSIVKLSIWSFT